MSKENETPLDILLIQLRNSVDTSIENGYVTVSLAQNMESLQSHSAMSTKNISRIVSDLERFGRLNTEDLPTVINALKKLA